MEAVYEFALNGPNMEFALYRIREGHPIPGRLFIDIIAEKYQLINKHLCRVIDHLVIMASITNTTASIRFHDIDLEDDNQILHVTLTNLPDLEDQLIHLWMEVHDLLHYYCIDDQAAEFASIDTFYSDLEYDALVQANFMDLVVNMPEHMFNFYNILTRYPVYNL